MTDDIIMRDAVPGAPSGRGGANCCHMPTPETKKMSGIYAGIRRTMVKAHCADSRPHHLCAGAITITRDTITLNCPRCGDLRKTLDGSNGHKGG